MNYPSVSVVIPTYNRGHMLKDAVSSVLEQTFTDFEIIIIDDGSNDDTREVIRSFEDARVRYVWQVNAGVSAARNHGIKLSKGKYISFLDSDDIYLNHCLEVKLKVMDDWPKCVLVGGGCRYFNGQSGMDCIPPSPARKEVGYRDLCIFTAFPGGTCNIFAPAEVLRKIGGFKDQLRCSEDRELLTRLCRLGDVKFANTPCVAIRLHDEVRQHRDVRQVLATRDWISCQIPELGLRRRSRAWNYMLAGTGMWQQGRYLKALIYWLNSFLIWPFSVHSERPRIRPIVRDYLLKRK